MVCTPWTEQHTQPVMGFWCSLPNVQDRLEMFACDRCCLDLHYQIHPAAKHLVDFLPFSLMCSLLMTHPQSYMCTFGTHKTHPACFIETEKRESHIHRCLIIKMVYCCWPRKPNVLHIWFQRQCLIFLFVFFVLSLSLFTDWCWNQLL